MCVGTGYFGITVRESLRQLEELRRINETWVLVLVPYCKILSDSS